MARTIKYRALIGVPEYSGEKATKKEIQEYQWNIMQTALKYWDSRTPVEPYPDFLMNPDKFYESLIKQTRTIRSIQTKINVDNPVAVLNYFGQKTGNLFLTDKPKKWREEDTRKVSKTGVYSYTILNPEGMFIKYDYPIKNSFNDIDVKSCKLVNRNYGTTHDMLEFCDIDWDATYIPEVAFSIYTKEVPISKGKSSKIKTINEIFEGNDPQEMADFFEERIGKHGMIAIIECEA